VYDCGSTSLGAVPSAHLPEQTENLCFSILIFGHVSGFCA